MGGISIWQLLIIAVIVVLLFGTKKLRGMGGDLGSAVKGFKDAMKEDNDPEEKPKVDTEVPKELTQQNQQNQTSAEKESEKDKGQG